MLSISFVSYSFCDQNSWFLESFLKIIHVRLNILFCYYVYVCKYLSVYFTWVSSYLFFSIFSSFVFPMKILCKDICDCKCCGNIPVLFSIINWAFTNSDILTLSLMVCKWVTSWNKFNNLTWKVQLFIFMSLSHAKLLKNIEKSL